MYVTGFTSINAIERGGRGFRFIQEKGKKMKDGVDYRIYFNKRPWKKRWRENRFCPEDRRLASLGTDFSILPLHE